MIARLILPGLMAGTVLLSATQALGQATGQAAALAAATRSETPPERDGTDTQTALTAGVYTRFLAASNLFEIRSAELAAARASSSDVKDFARRMIADHQDAAQKLKTVLRQQRMAQPPMALSPDQSRKLGKLATMRGRTFDSLYIEQQLAAHDETIATVARYAANGDNAPLRTLSETLLPTLRAHRQHADQLAAGHNESGAVSR